MGVIADINNMVKIAQIRLGGTMFAQRRKSPAATTPAAAGTGQASSAPRRGFGWSAGDAGSTQTVRASTGAAGGATAAQAPSAASAAQEFNFGREAKALIRPFMQDHSARQGAYSDEGNKRYQKMIKGFSDTVRDMKANPGKYTEQQQRDILRKWKEQIQGFKGWQKGESKNVGKPAPGTVLFHSFLRPGVWAPEHPRDEATQGRIISTRIDPKNITKRKITDKNLARAIGRDYVLEGLESPAEIQARKAYVAAYRARAAYRNTGNVPSDLERRAKLHGNLQEWQYRNATGTYSSAPQKAPSRRVMTPEESRQFRGEAMGWNRYANRPGDEDLYERM